MKSNNTMAVSLPQPKRENIIHFPRRLPEPEPDTDADINDILTGGQSGYLIFQKGNNYQITGPTGAVEWLIVPVRDANTRR